MQQPENVHMETLIKLVENLSNGDPGLSIERKDAVKVWIAARYLQFDTAEKMANQILDRLIQRPEHVYRLWRLARRDGLSDLEKVTFTQILQRMPRGVCFADSEHFLQCSVDEVTALLTHDGYVPDCEPTVYQAVLRWYMHDTIERTQHLHPLLDACVVWDQIDIDTLIISTTGELHEALMQILSDRLCGLMGGGALLKRAAPTEAIFYHMRDGHSHQLLHFDFTRNELTKLNTPVQATLVEHSPTIKADGFAVAVGRELIVGTEPNQEMMAMDCISGSTRTLMVESLFNECMCVVAVGSEIYAAGANWSQHSEDWFCFNVVTGKLLRASQLPFYTFEKEPPNLVQLARNNGANAVQLIEMEMMQNMIYAKRGIAALIYRYYRASMEAYPLPHGRIVFVSVGSVDEKHATNPESMVETYDIRSNKWTKHTGWKDETKFQHRCSAIVFQGYLYFTGGCVDAEESFYWEKNGNAVATCYRVSLSHAQAEPERIADLNVARYQHCAFIKDGQMWVYGGTTHVDGDNQRKRALMSFERYDATKNQWTLVDVPMTKELQAEVAGGDCAQKTVHLPHLQHHIPAACVGDEYEGNYEDDDHGLKYKMTDEFWRNNNCSDDDQSNEWPTGLDD
ncbi:uncharacterized protein LOC129595783 [Paramacrobiotus metropolitanus]|uniref:uncharacterized protein LOC129595783 n=1 Tax=Paramacrobiotus metropolitanus TaxID=2943436 RepID=UPI0024463448|nr:uncharacterized protein LOC129595783 [Paramacrobiotus metropolitanus]